MNFPQPISPSRSVRHPWYGIRTRSNQEKIVATCLDSKGFEQYLPTHRVRRRWSDRRVEKDVPLFAGYVFCRFEARQRLPILTTPGVVSVVGFGNEPVAIPEPEIEAIQTILASGFFAEPCNYFHEGQRVCVMHGVLEGLQGILIRKKNEWRVVVSVTTLQRSIAVEIDRDCLDPLPHDSATKPSPAALPRLSKLASF